MKKVLVILLTACLMIAMTGCSTAAPYTCDFCAKESTSKKHTVNMAGDKLTVCDECYTGLSELVGN